MKKALILLLSLTLLFSASSCSGSLATETATETAVKETKTKEEKVVTVPDPLTNAKVDAIPIATDTMTEEELRQICLDYYRLQLSYTWTPSHDFTYEIEAYELDVPIKKGVVYSGSPYDGGHGNLYKILHIYDSNTGVLDSDTKPEYLTQIFGNNCTTASHWGWARVSNTMRFGYTVSVTEPNGAIKLGPFQYENEGKNHKSTRDVCKANGEQIMFQSYAALKPADGVVLYNGAGHVMMACSEPHIEYLPDGSIDGKKSYVLFMEQVSGWSDVEIDGIKCKRQGRIDEKYTFQDLYNKSYLPFTVAELIGRDPVEAGEANLILPEGEELTVQSLSKGKIVANYEISDITVQVLSAEGECLYSYVCNLPWLKFETSLSTAVFPASINPHAKKEGTRILLSVRIGNGEVFTVLDQALDQM